MFHIYSYLFYAPAKKPTSKTGKSNLACHANAAIVNNMAPRDHPKSLLWALTAKPQNGEIHSVGLWVLWNREVRIPHPRCQTVEAEARRIQLMSSWNWKSLEVQDETQNIPRPQIRWATAAACCNWTRNICQFCRMRGAGAPRDSACSNLMARHGTAGFLSSPCRNNH